MHDPVLSYTVVHDHLCHKDDCDITPVTNNKAFCKASQLGEMHATKADVKVNNLKAERLWLDTNSAGVASSGCVKPVQGSPGSDGLW